MKLTKMKRHLGLTGLRMIALLVFTLVVSVANAQRIQSLGRGVVAVANGGTVTVTWRRLAQEPENAKYNIYVAKNGSESYTKITSSPVSLTNYQTTTSIVSYGSKVAVTMVDANGNEGAMSVPFSFVNNSWKDAYRRVNYEQAGSPLRNSTEVSYFTKFIWPVDLDGDGEMDYVVDRISSKTNFGGTQDNRGNYIEAYSSEGKHLWTVCLGPNIFCSTGQNDGITVGDFDCDGKGDVMVQVSDGCQLWDKQNNTFGKYLAYGTNDGSSADTDGDGIINYTTSRTENPQYYMLCIDGETGAQKAVCKQSLAKDNDMEQTRHNKTDYFGDEYPYPTMAMGTAYLDGVHPSAVGQFQLRTSNGAHHYFTYAYSFFDNAGQTTAGELKEVFKFAFDDNGHPSEFHHLRIADVDGDGCDEVMNGCYALDNNGKMLWNSKISHGDRFRLSDIDPDRPGLEIFAIQQNAPDMLGQILYSATDGKAIKKWYMGSVGDVGRGECMDVLPEHKGYEMWSTLPNMYNAKGDIAIQGNNKSAGIPYPTEGLWWDGELDREGAWTPGSGNEPPMVIGKYDRNSSSYSRQIQPSSESGWQTCGHNGARPLFWGDIVGDWREEMILRWRLDGYDVGFVCYSTDITTSNKNIYCLLQDPAYFGQITNRGYYQSPNTGFYLGYDMPRPQLPPVMKADAENDVFGLTLGNATITPSASAKNVYVMPVKGQTLTLASAFAGSADLWKSQQGTLVMSGSTSTGTIYISEGTLQFSGTITSPIELRARGVLTGTGTVGSVTLEGSLNYAEGVIRPVGTLTIDSNMAFNKECFVDIDIDGNALLKVNGNLSITKPLTFSIAATDLKEGEYKLLEYTGTFSETQLKNVSMRGLSGLSYNIICKDNAIVLKVNGQRDSANGVKWTGATNTEWDYQTQNWELDGTPTTFVAGDTILIDDTTDKNVITANVLMPTGGVTFDNSQDFTIQGNGGMSGAGGLTKNGVGKLTLAATKADYKGATIINEGTVVIKDLAEGGNPSSIGAASVNATNFQIGKAKVTIENVSAATNRGITLLDTANINIPSGTTSLKGRISGAGVLYKTGTGQLSLSYDGANTYTGGTILAAGTIAQGTYQATLGSTSAKLHVTGNSKFIQFYTTSSGNAPNFQHPIEIDSARTLTFVGTGRGAFRAKLTGKGTLDLSSAYVRFDNYMNASAFEGTVILEDGNVGRFVQAIDLSKATLNLKNEGSYASSMKAGGGDTSSYTHKIGSLIGAGGLGAGTWNIGYLGTNDTYSGAFGSSASVNKYGEGALILTGASSAPISIREGKVFANNTSAATTTGTITVYEGGELVGQGTAQSVVVKAGGTIGAQQSVALASMPKTLTLKGTLTVEAGGILDIGYRSTATKTTFDAISVAGKTTLNSPVIQFTQLNEAELLLDTEFKILPGNGTITLNGEVTILPERPAAGYKWDASTLATDGTIRIAEDPTGIESVSADDSKSEDCEPAVIYDINGRRLSTATDKGVYIINGNKVVK